MSYCFQMRPSTVAALGITVFAVACEKVVPTHQFCDATAVTNATGEVWRSTSRNHPPDEVPLCFDVTPKGGTRLVFMYEFLDARGSEDASGMVLVGRVEKGVLRASYPDGSSLEANVSFRPGGLALDVTSSPNKALVPVRVEYSCADEAQLEGCNTLCCAMRR